MKYFLLAVTLIVAVSFTRVNNKTSNKKETYYYFCDSKARTLSGSAVSNQKEIVLYTEVSEISPKNIKETAQKWSKLINGNCTNQNGCTSDLNYYPSLEKAEEQYKRALVIYSDTSKYLLRRISFTAIQQ